MEINEENLTVCILAGGQSARMGREKSALMLGGKTFLELIAKTVQRWNSKAKIKVITKDVVERCGPLGGVLTAFERVDEQQEGWFLFLSCDMPFISPALLNLIVYSSFPPAPAAFCFTAEGAGFPFLLSSKFKPQTILQHARKRFSLQNLALQLNAKLVDPIAAGISTVELRNINTPEDFLAALKIFEKSSGGR